jgi:hypothetical protein
VSLVIIMAVSLMQTVLIRGIVTVELVMALLVVGP